MGPSGKQLRPLLAIGQEIMPTSCPPSFFHTRSTRRSVDLCFLRVLPCVIKSDTISMVKVMYISSGIKWPKNGKKIDFGQEGQKSSIGSVCL
jgi:hypothetical protein